MLKVVDVSLYNIIGDYALLKQSVSAILIKSSQGTVEDPTFRAKLAGSRGAGLRAGIWHFYHPDMPAQPQIDAFMKIWKSLDPKPGWIGLDCEESTWFETIDGENIKHTVLPPSVGAYSAWLEQWLSTVESRTGIIPTVYTRLSWWNQWVSPSTKWSHYPLWVANYGVTKPMLPRDWKTWQFWQWGTSLTLGVKTAVDSDWFAGSEQDLDKLFNIPTVIVPTVVIPEPVPQEEPPAPPPPPLMLFEASVVVDALNVRTGPGTNYTRTGQISQGETVQVSALSGREVWFQIGPGRWVAGRFNGDEYVK